MKFFPGLQGKFSLEKRINAILYHILPILNTTLSFKTSFSVSKELETYQISDILTQPIVGSVELENHHTVLEVDNRQQQVQQTEYFLKLKYLCQVQSLLDEQAVDFIQGF